MDERDFQEALESAGLSDIGVLTEKPSWAKVSFGIEGTMVVAGTPLRIGVGLLADFPASLPKIYVLSDTAKDLPHVDSKRCVCAVPSDGVLHDVRRPVDLVTETLARARNTLEEGLLGRNTADFLQEVEAYWARDLITVSLIEANDEPREILAVYSPKGELLAMTDTLEAFRERFPGVPMREHPALYIPLDPTKVIHAHPQRFDSWPSRLVDEVSDPADQLVQQFRVSKNQTFGIVLGVPRPTGGRALIGLLLEKFIRDDRLLCATPTTRRRLSFDRFDLVHLRERVAPQTLKRITVIGCGAVGGHVAHALAWTGVSELVLVDPDVYKGGNVFRHPLGLQGWGSLSKAVGLERQLNALLPNLKITALPITANDAFVSHGEMLKGSDVIIVAIGNPTVPLHVNDDLAERRYPVPVIYTWLEPYGIGGHAALVRYGAKGCLRCLFVDEPILRNLADFAAPNQNFTRHELGCYGTFTPYGDLDARETATLAVRLAIEAAQEPKVPACLRSWRGDATSFRASGFSTSRRYDDYNHAQDPILLPRNDCPICGGQHRALLH